MVKPLSQPRRIAAPQVIERDDAPAQLRERDPDYGVRGNRGQAHLHTLDALGTHLERAEGKPAARLSNRIRPATPWMSNGRSPNSTATVTAGWGMARSSIGLSPRMRNPAMSTPRSAVARDGRAISHPAVEFAVWRTGCTPRLYERLGVGANHARGAS
jgi:hypothetical protein